MSTYDSAQALDVCAATYDELKARFVALAPIEAAIRDERKALSAELDRRDRSAAAVTRLSAMTDAQKDALREALR